MLSRHTPTSRPRLRRTATQSARGERPEVTSTATGGSLRRRRRAGAATPAATRAQAVTMMALDTRKGAPVYGAPAPTGGRPAGLECRALRPHRIAAVLGRRAPQLLIGTCFAIGAALVLAPDAMAGFITPESSGSPNAHNIDTLYKIILYIAAFVFVGVEGALLYS